MCGCRYPGRWRSGSGPVADGGPIQHVQCVLASALSHGRSGSGTNKLCAVGCRTTRRMMRSSRWKAQHPLPHGHGRKYVTNQMASRISPAARAAGPAEPAPLAREGNPVSLPTAVVPGRSGRRPPVPASLPGRPGPPACRPAGSGEPAVLRDASEVASHPIEGTMFVCHEQHVAEWQRAVPDFGREFGNRPW